MILLWGGNKSIWTEAEFVAGQISLGMHMHIGSINHDMQRSVYKLHYCFLKCQHTILIDLAAMFVVSKTWLRIDAGNLKFG